MDAKFAGLFFIASVLGVGAGYAVLRSSEGASSTAALATAGVVFFGVAYGGRWTVIRAVADDPVTRQWAAGQRPPQP